MGWIKKGEKFLPELSKAELTKLYQKEKNAKAKLRLLAAIFRKEGKSLDFISESVQTPKTTVHDWLKRLESEGLDGLIDNSRPGRPSWLSQKQKDELETVLSGSPEGQGIPFKIWTTSLVQYIIHELFNVTYKPRNVQKLVKKLGFVLKVPRSRNKKASTKAQEEFKKKLKLKYGITLNLDLRSSFWMKRTSE
jgi:transposase